MNLLTGNPGMFFFFFFFFFFHDSNSGRAAFSWKGVPSFLARKEMVPYIPVKTGGKARPKLSWPQVTVIVWLVAK